MAQTITIELLQLLEDKLGKEEGRKVASAIEVGLEVIEKKAEGVVLQKKLEIRDELSKELITKAEFFGEIKTVRQEMETLRQEMQTIRQEMQTIKVELEGKIDRVKIELNTKLNFLIILMIIALTLMNPVAAEIIKKALKL